MIRHVIRQELAGGYWLIRDEGRVLELNEHGYALISRLYASSGRLDACEDLLHGENEPTGQRTLLENIRRQGLDEPRTWQTVRHLPLDASRETLPGDCVVAPKRIYFEITRGCNLRCRSCFNRSGEPLENELTLNEILDVNRQAYEMGVFEIRYTGGECTTVPGFAEVVADARRRGFYVSMGTNGVYTNGQLEWLPNCGVDWFILSLDGDRETNDRIRGAGVYDRVMHTLNVLARTTNTRIRLNMVVAKHNVGTIESVARVAAEYGLESLNLIPLRPYGRSLAKMTADMFRQRDFYDFIREVNRLRRQFPSIVFSTTIDLLDPDAATSHDLIVQKKTTCAAGVEACVVGPKGDVYGCSYSPASFPDSIDKEGKALFIAGNVRLDDLRTIWRESTRWSVFRDLAQYKNPKCLECAHYTVRCSGSCPIMAWHEMKHREQTEQGQRHIRDFCDPYCFVDLLDSQSRTSDSSGPSEPVGAYER